MIDVLYETAEGQAGYFTTTQADERGVSRQLLHHHEQSGSIRRVARGVYRLTHFPAQAFEDVIITTLWAGSDSVASHETALSVHGIGDAMPSVTHITIPNRFRGKRTSVILHIADVPLQERTRRNGVPVTTVERTLVDVASESDHSITRTALQDALHRGLTTPKRLRGAINRHADDDGLLEQLLSELS